MIFHKHKGLEVYRQLLYEDSVWHIFTSQSTLNSEITLITFSCDKCGEIYQKKLNGHVPKEGIGVPDVFRKGMS